MALNVSDLITYLREPAEKLDLDVLGQIVDLTNGTIADVIGDLVPEPSRVQAIRLTVAARAYWNPRGFSSGSRQIDDYVDTWRVDAAQAGVYLTDAERAELLGMLPNGPVLDAEPWAGSIPYRRPWWC